MRGNPGAAGWNITGAIIVLMFIIILLLPSLAGLALDYLWYDSLGYADVFLVRFTAELLLFLLAALVSALFLYLIYRLGRSTLIRYGGRIVSLWDSPIFTGYARDYIDVRPKKEIVRSLDMVRLPVFIIILFLSIVQGVLFSNSWLTVLKYINSTPFGVNDPIFGKEIAFYVFSLPFYKVVLNHILVLLFFGLLILAGLYATFNWKLLTRRMPADLRLLLGVFLFILAVLSYLGRYNILYSESGVVYGAGYIDVAIRQYIPVLIAIVLLLAAALILVRSPPRVLMWMIAGIVLISFVGGITAALLQEYKVSPDELQLERPYIVDNIGSTNHAYGLDTVEVRPYPLTYNLTRDILNDPSITNARVWDYRPLLTTYQQKQAIRTYYGFNDVDVDRYFINGSKDQVWLSAREIFYDQLLGKADTWLNKHVLYTHGTGVVMSPVNRVVDQGLPQMYLENIPPVSSIPSLNVTQPRIYYGERTDTYIFTGTGRDEFDYPSGSTNVFTMYSGTGGIDMGGINKIIATLALGDLKIFTSPDIGEGSKLHIYRNVLDRVGLITPYLLADNDAYVVVGDDGRLYWFVNAFSYSSRYPYSEPLWVGNTKVNYIRDSTRAVIDAYNGTTTYYIIEDDPLLTTYSKIFPGVFKPYDQMPDQLKLHMRYSPDLFLIQSMTYTDYHMTVPEVFYNREDRWQQAKEKYANSLIAVEPYNILLDINGSTNFIMMMPFTPYNKDNMIAWMAVDQEPMRFGQKILYEFPKDRLIYGPSQVEALIDQDVDISKDLTLWGQGGSEVIRGNLLVIPIRGSIIYIEPLYIKAETQSSIPELKKILVVYENRVVMADSLEEGIMMVLGSNITVPPPAAEDQTLDELLDNILLHYNRAKGYLNSGDLENYAREMRTVDSLMDQLQKLLSAD